MRWGTFVAVGGLVLMFLQSASGAQLACPASPSSSDGGSAPGSPPAREGTERFLVPGEDYAMLAKFGVAATPEDSSTLLTLLADKSGHKILGDDGRREQYPGVVLFLSVGGVTDILYLRRESPSEFVNASSDVIRRANCIWVFYLTDFDPAASMSIDLVATQISKTIKRASFDSTPPPPLERSNSERPKGYPLELGFRVFEIPFRPGVLELSFTRRDQVTATRRQWTQRLTVTRDHKFYLDVGFLIPFKSIGFDRYSLTTNRTVLPGGETLATTDLVVTHSDRFGFLLVQFGFDRQLSILPSVVLGFGLPAGGSNIGNYPLFAGINWPLKGELLGITAGVSTIKRERPMRGISVGPLETGRTEFLGELVDSKREWDFVVGITISLGFLGRLG